MKNRLIPVQNAWVKYTFSSGQERLGRVEATIPRQDGIHVRVKWHNGDESTLPEIVNVVVASTVKYYSGLCSE